MHAPLNQEIINDTAKLIMHRLIARWLVRDPSLVHRAKASLAKDPSESYRSRSSAFGLTV
jgi:hypothetical protein